MQIRPPALPPHDHCGTAAARLPRRWRLAALVVLVTGSVLLGSCSTIRVFTDFTEVLRDAGFDDVSVTIDSRGAGILVISASAPGGDTLDEAHERAAELVWQRFPRRFEAVRITLDGERRDHTRAQLEERYGPRPASLDETDLTDEVTRFGVTALVAAAIAGMLVLVGVGLVIFLVLRARRRRAPGPTPFGPPGARPPGTGHPTPWMPVEVSGPAAGPPPPGEASGATTGSTPPTPAPPAWPPPEQANGPIPMPRPHRPPPEDRRTRRRLGRRPPGPPPPADQTPPGWGG